MKNEIITAEISNLIDVIKEQQDAVLTYNGKIPQIELDILMGNVRKLYECLSVLSKQNNSLVPEKSPAPAENIMSSTDELIAHIAVEDSIIVPDNPTVEVIHEQIAVTEITSPEHAQPELLFAIAEQTPVINQAEIFTETIPLTSERSKQFTKPTSKPQQMASLFDEPVTVAEKFKDSPSIYDKLSASKPDNSLAEKLLKNPVSDLKKSIGINEKFAFINDLFDGDLNFYNEAIDKLNNSSNQLQAIDLLEQEYSNKFNWNQESDAYIKLRLLIERRFLA
jgi:hypothetical protein